MDLTEVIAGFVLGLVVALLMSAIIVRQSDYVQYRIECEKVVPRNQKCVNIWVPETK